MKKMLVAMLALLSTTSHVHAQGMIGNPEFNREDNGNLYNLKSEQRNHHFEYQLPGEGVLKIDFLRLSDWGQANELPRIAGIAAQQAAGFRDSFHSATSSKTLEINVPIDGEVLSVNLYESGKDQRQMAFRDGKYYQLKTSYDTLRVLRNVRIRSEPGIDSGLVQVEYTFVLKALEDMAGLAADRDLFPRLGRLTDSVIAAKRKQWRRQDASGHNLTLSVDANNRDSLYAYNNRGNFLYGRYIGAYISLGAIAYNSSISPFLEMGVAYLIPTNTRLQGFIGFNMNAFGFLTAGKTLSKSQGHYITYNGEIGFCKKGMPLMPLRTSLLVGAMYIRDEKPLFNFGFNVAVNRYASIGLTLASNYKKAEKGGRSVIGISFKLNF